VTLETIHLSRKALNLREFAHSDSVEEENLADKFPVLIRQNSGTGEGKLNRTLGHSNIAGKTASTWN